MQSYEVEVKALLGSAERAADLRRALKETDPDWELTSHNKQLNHYFEGGTLSALAETMRPHLAADVMEKLDHMAANAREFSVRTRDKDNIVLLVVKASLGDDTSANGVARIEFEAHVPLGILELDELVLQSGFQYQAKWSREREEYAIKGLNVCLDKNAGYGYLAEFERVVDDSSKVDEAKREVHALMERLGVAELPQDRLERMFAYYNAHWPEYYGTDRIFVIE